MSNQLALSQARVQITVAAVSVTLLSATQPALAHHALDGKLPVNFFEGFLSGLAHPVIGLDHLAFVIAIGLIAAGQIRGALIPGAFILAALAGTGIHLLELDVPAAESAIALSVIAIGAMLILPHKPNVLLLTILSAIAGIFHGYAYGEAIVGAEMTPLFAYLLGFSCIQYLVALLAKTVGNLMLRTNRTLPMTRLIGIAICTIGVVFLSNSLTS